MSEESGQLKGVLLKLGAGLAWACAVAVISLEVRLHAIEENRFTPKDALIYERNVDARFDKVDASIAEVVGDIKVIKAMLEEARKGR